MAAQENHGEVVKYLLAHNANQNLATEGGFLPLEVATQQGHYKIVETLLQHQSRPKYPPKQEDGYTPLAVALQQGHDKVVAVLLENDRAGKTRLPALHICSRRDDTKAALLLLQSGHNPDITSKSGFTPLHIAAHYGHVNVATLLLQRGASVDHAARNNITPLHVAAKWGRVNMVNTLLDRGARIDAKTRDGLTPLHCSARSGHDQCVDQLLERGAPISAKTKNGLAPLHMAAQGDHVDSARLLLYHKAPVDDVTVDYLTPLHVAAHCGHHRVAKLLLDRKANPSARALNGFTPLHIACKKNRVKVIELLLKYGASIHATTESGLTPLHVASFMGNINIVGYLINHGASVDETNVRGETALHLAARANQIDIIRVLLRNGAKVDARAAENQTPLHIAARLGNVEIVTLLLENGASPDAQTRDHYTALHIAAREGKEDVAAVLLDHGASLSMQTKKEFTPLHVAAKYGRLGVASLLLKHYAAPDATAQNGLTPLHIAAHYDNVEVAMLLLDQGASPHTVAQNGFTPLHIAAKKNQLDVATTLLEYGADPNCMTKQGISPIHLAAQEGHTDMLSLLLERGAKPDIAAKNGLTPLHLAAQEDQLDCAKVLVKNGSGIDPRTKAGYTPLHVACHYGNLKTAAYLLQNGAAIQAKTKHGLTPLHQASQQGHVAIINLLLTKGADPNETANNGYTALAIAKRFGYISVVNTLTTVTTVETTIVQSPTDEKLKVQVPETMVISFMSDNEDEELGSPADDISMTGDNSLLTPQEIKTMGDDSMPIANRKSWEEEWMSGEPNLRYYSGSDSLSGRYSTPQSGKYRGAMLSPQGFDSRASTLNRDIPLSEAEESFVDGGEVISRTTEITVESAAPLMSSSPAMRHTLNVTTPDGKRVSVGDPYIDEDGKLLEGMVYGQDGRPVSAALSDNAPLSSIPIFAGFLISFMVDARGGTMKSCRLPGLRVVIPPKRASGPTRVTCRLIKKSKLTTPPPLLENETLATRVLEVGPSNTQFLGGLGNKLIHSPPLNDGEQLVNGIMEFGPPAEKFIGPVLIEVPHFASLRGKEREIVILRSEKGDTWKEHSLDAKDTEVHKALEGYEGDDDNNVNSDRRICRILTNDFPQYFAIISRVRQETNTIGTSGGMLSSTVVPQVQAVFPEGTLTKKIKVGLQAQPVGNEVVKKVLGNRVMVSPIVTIEPRRRKFHKAITVTIPIPNNQGIINGYGGDTPTLRLLCSITGGTAPAQWEDITGTTPLTFVDNCVSFTTTVSARFWLMDCKEIDQASNFARELYHELKAVPFMARFAIYAKTHDPIESRVRVYCVTDDRTDKTLEQQEHFKEVARSKDVEVLESKPIYIEMAGNLVPVQKSGDQLHLVFSPFHENRLPFFVRVRDSATEPCGRLSFMSEPKVTRGMPPQKALCNLNITMPPFVKVKRPSESESESESSEEEYRMEKGEREQYSQQKEGKTTITQIYSLTRVDEYPKDEAASNLNFASIKLRKKYTFLQDPAMSPTSAHARAEIRLMQVAKEIGTDWRALGRQLGVSEKDLQEIENENDEIEEQAFVMLHAWAEDAKENATTDKLSDALHEIGRGDVANKCLADYAVMDVSIDREEDTSDFLRDMERAMYEASLKHDEDKHKPGVTIDITGDDGGAFRELQDEIEADKDLDSYSGKIVKEVHRTVTTRTEVRTERRVPSDIETAVKEQAKDEVAESLIKELKEEAIAAGIPEDAGAAELYEEMKEEILEKHEEERREMQFEPTVDVLEESQEEDGQTPTETKDVKEELQQPEQKPKEKLVEQVEAKTRRGGESVPEAPQEREEPSVEPALSSEPEVAVYGTTVFREERITTTKVTKTMRTTDGGISVPDVAEVTTSVVFQSKDAPVEPVEVSPEEKEGNVQEEALVAEKVALEEAEKKVVVVEEEAEKPPEEPSEDIVEEIPEELRDVKEERVKQPDVTKEPEVKPEEDVRIEEIPDDIPAKRVAETEGPPQTEADVLVQTTIHKTETVVHREVIHITSTAEEEPEEIQEDRSPEPQADVEVEEDKVEAAVVEVTPEVPLEEEETEKDDTTVEEEQELQEEPVLEEEGIEEEAAPEEEVAPQVLPAEEITPEETYTELDQEPLKEIVMEEERIEEMAALEEVSRKAVSEEEIAPEAAFGEPEEQRREEEVVGEQGFEEETGPGEVAPDVALEEEEAAPEEIYEEPEKELKEEGVVEEEALKEEVAPEEEIVPEVLSERKVTEPEEIDQEPQEVSMEEKHAEAVVPVDVAQHIPEEDKMQVHTETHISVQQTIVKSTVTYFHEEARTSDEEAPGAAALPVKEDIKNEEEVLTELEPAVEAEEGIEEKATEICLQGAEVKREEEIVQEITYEEPEPVQEEVIMEKEKIEEKSAPEVEAVPEDVWEYKKTAPQEPEEEPEEVAAAEEEVKEAAVEEVVPVAPKDTFQEPEQQPDEVVVAEEMIGEEVAPEVMLKEEETAPEEQEQEPQEEIVVKEEIAEEAAPEQEVVPEIPSDQEIQEKEGTEVEEYHKEPDRELEDVEEKMEVHTETHISAHQTIVQSSFVYGLHEEARTTEKEPSEEAMLPDKADVQKEEEPPQELEAIVREERIEEEAAPEVEVAPEILLEKDMAPEKPPEEPEQEPEEEAVAEEERIEEEPVPEAEYEEAEQEPEEEFILKEERVEEEAAPEVEVTPECLLEEKLSSKETLGEPEQEPQKEVEEERSEEDVAPEEIVPDVVPQEEEIAQERLSEGPGPELHEELVVEEGRIEEEAAPAVEEYPERDVGEPQKLEHVELARKEPMEPKQVLFSTHETIHTEKRTFVQQTIVQTTVSEVHGEREQHFLPEEPVEIMGKESDQEEVLEDVQDQEVVKVEYEQDTALAEGQEDIPDSLEEQIEDQQEPELTPEAVAEAEVGIAREIRVVEESVSVHRLVEHIEAKEQESEQPSVQYQEDVRLETMEDEEQETEQEREMEPLEKEEEEELEEIAMGVEEAEVLAEEPAEDVVEEILEEPKEEEVEEGEKATEPVTEEVVMETQKHIESEAVFRYDVDQEVAKEKPSVEEETDEVLDDIPRSPFPQLEESEEERKSEPILEDEYHLEVDEEYSADAGISEDADIEDNLIDEKQEEHEKPHIPEILDITETYSSQSYTHLREEHVAIIESPAYTPEKTPRGDDSDKEDGRHSPEIETEDRRSSLEVIQIEEKYLVETPSGEPSFRDDVEKLGIEHEIIKETETVEHTYVAPPVDLSLREEQAGLEEEAVLPPTPEITPIPDSPIESDGELKEAVYTQQEEQILEVPQDLDLQQQTEQYDTLQTPEIQELPDTPESLPEPAPHYEEDYQEDFKEELQEEPVTEDQERREDEAMEEEVQLVDGPTEQAYYDPNLLVQPAAEGIQEPLEEQEDKSETLDQQQQETPELVEEQREEDEQAREQEPKPEEEQTIEEEPKEDLQPLTPLPSPEDEAQALAQESERLESSDIQARLEEEIQEDRLLEATTIQESFYSQTIVTTEESAFILGEPAVETADSITLPGVPEPVTESEGQLPSPGDEEDSHKPPPHKLAPPPGQEVEGKDDEVDSPTKPVAVGVVGSVAVASFEEPRLQDRAPSEDSEIEDDLEEKPCEEDEGMYEEESARDEALASDEGDVDKDVVEGDAEVEMPEPQDEEEMEAEKHTDAQEFAEEEEVEGETEAMQELQDETSQEREVEELEECPLNEEPMEEEPIQEEAEIAPPDTMEQEPVSGFTESSEVTTRTVYAEVHHERVVVASSQAFVESTPEEQDQLEIQLSSSLHTEPPVDEQFDAADRPDVPEDKPRATQEDIEALAIALNEFTMPTFEDEEAPKTYEQAEGDVGEEEPIEGQDVSTEESAPPRRRPEEVGPSFLTSDDEKEIQELWDRTQELPENATLEFTTMAEAAPVVESSAPVVELAPDSDRYEGDSSPEERQFSESPLSSTSEDRQAGPPEPKTPDITDMDECPFSLKENLPKISTEPTVEFPPEVQEPGEANGDQPVQYSEQPEQEQLPSDSAVAKPVVSDPNEDVQEIVEEFEEELPDGTIRKVTRKRIIRRVMQTVEVDPNDPNFVMPQGEPDEDGVHRITVHKKTSRKTVIRDGEEVDVTEDVETNIQEDGEEVERSELREDLQRMVDQFLSEDAKAAAEVTEVKEDPEESEI
ncbi:ankyrin-2-like isoform X25 [Acanthaster planci]|uniref:Ankyrin-2-like isoform X25 n=1 Tax=Acanthaster planci TaxID=133434 RepID=A0A8B7XHD8_ACAPL|nr:ankyrin-2-like isoform X25 [Acanthaster planci]